MGWTLPQTEHETFRRNPLVAVIAQLRFHPILKVPDRISDFQEAVRQRFPGFTEATTRDFNFQPPFGIELREGKEFQFRSTSGLSSLTLGTGALALEARRHTSRADFFAGFEVAVAALEAVYSPINPIRLGLRYVNSIDLESIGRDLDAKLAWNDLVDGKFLKLPGDLANLDGTLFAVEVNSTIADGKLTLRSGLLQSPPDGQVTFRLDFDRYLEGDLAAGEAMPRLRRFSDDIYALFRCAAGPRLLEWMQRGGGE